VFRWDGHALFATGERVFARGHRLGRHYHAGIVRDSCILATVMKTKTLALAFVAMLMACGGSLNYKIASSAKAPGADATIKADVSKDQHLTHLKVDALNLAPPERVTPGTRIFIIWTRKNAEATWARAGNLEYNPSGREGLFEGTVPEVDFDLQITVEKDDNAASPSADMIFSQHVGPA
jgi:hypothetical protein